MLASPGNLWQTFILLKLHHLQNKAPHTIGNFSSHTPVCALHIAFKAPYIYDYIIQLWRQRPEVLKIHENADMCNIAQCEDQHKVYKT
jgi:hypothetical protein